MTDKHQAVSPDWGRNWHELFQLSPQPMWVYNLDTLRFIDVNHAALIHYGYSFDEFVGMTIFDLSLEEDIANFKFLVPYIKTFKRKESNEVYRHLKKNGEIIEVQISSNLLTSSAGQVALIVINDITAILQSERQLQESRDALLKSEKRFKSLVQEGSDLIAVVDPEGIYTFLSQSFTTVLGHVPERMIGRNAFDFVHPHDKEKFFETLKAVLHIKRVYFEPFRFLNGDNEWRWIFTTATNLMDDPAINGIVTNSKDITEGVMRNEELRLSNERYKLVLKAADEAIWDWDIENDVTDWGIGFQEIFGYDLSIYNNTLWSDNIHPEDRPWVMDEIGRAVADPEQNILYAEYRFLKANREVAITQFRGLFLRDEKGKAIRAVASFRDITANKQTLYQVQKQNERLKEIAWTQSHKVRAPLARILALVQLLKIDTPAGSDQEELLQNLHASAEELDLVIRQIVRKTEALDR